MNFEFDSMEIGTFIHIYCYAIPKYVYLVCQDNGIANDWDLTTGCDRHDLYIRDCFDDSEFDILKNLKPNNPNLRKYENTERRKFVCIDNKMAKINGLYYKKLDIQCIKGRFYMGDYASKYAYGREITEIVDCKGPF